VKFSKLLESILDEAESEAAEQAKGMGLIYKGYGRWADQTGKIVAKTVGNQLTKLDAPETQPGAGNPEAPGAEPTDVEPIARDGNANPDTAVGGDLPDSYTNPEMDNPDVEPETPKAGADLGIERLLAAAGGDSLKVRKALVKKFRAGDEKAKVLLSRLDQFDAQQKAGLQQSIDAVAQRRADALATKKAKYAEKYPSPQV
jgi:hypothetical protein